jgi:uncharacterized protein (TIGR02118 family)
MITRIGVAPRRPGMTTAAFQAHWAGSHARAVAPLPGLARYWQNHAVLAEGEPLLPWPGFDACSELDFPDAATMEAAFASPAYFDRVKPDEDVFVDKSAGGLMLTRREVLDGPVLPDTGLRLWRFMRLAPGRQAADLAHALADAPPVADTIARERFFALPESATGRAPIFDAAETFWFDTSDAALAALRSPAMRARMAGLAALVRGTEHLLARVVPVPPKPQ